MTAEIRICRGPVHTDGPVELPLTEEHWYFHKTGERQGKPLAQCITCMLFKKTGKDVNTGRTVPSEKVRGWTKELVGRLGMVGASRYSGLSPTTLRAIVNNSHATYQRATVAKLLLAVRSARREGLMRHKKSIAHGAAARGRRERRVTRVSDQYGPVYPELEREHRDREQERKRTSRMRKDQKLKLSGPQVIAMFNLLQMIGLRHVTEFNLVSRDDYGHVILDVTTDSCIRRFKLFKAQGSEELTPPSPVESATTPLITETDEPA